MPELVDVDEEKEVSDQAVRDLDTQRKYSNKDYVGKKLHARDRNVREGDTVLLEKKKENKLSPCYEKEPYEVVSRYGPPQGVQYKRNLQYIKPLICQIRKNKRHRYRMLNHGMLSLQLSSH